MFTEDKVTEIFCLADDFKHFFDSEMKKCVIEEENATQKRQYHRDFKMSRTEIMVILIMFHCSGHRCLKHFYLHYVSKHHRHGIR